MPLPSRWQAVELGHPDRAVDLVDAASAALGGRYPLRVPWMNDMRAKAYAAAR
ncbi:hypothetical protein ACQP1K_27320 [Sphaerimonospora sp. CA-214678]|uniref:hypothetical protein n=1 Tax=Sphaerimonospora sp. CA-214678 TaxID=3240029 RepID=UPI003D8A1AD2